MKNEINKSELASQLRSGISAALEVKKDPKIKAGLGSLVRLPLQVKVKRELVIQFSGRAFA